MIDHRAWFYLLTFVGLVLDGLGVAALFVLALIRKPPDNPQ